MSNSLLSWISDLMSFEKSKRRNRRRRNYIAREYEMSRKDGSVFYPSHKRALKHLKHEQQIDKKVFLDDAIDDDT